MEIGKGYEMKKFGILMISLCLCFSLCLAGCGGSAGYEKAVREAFVSDAGLNGGAMRANLEDAVGEDVTCYPPKKEDVRITVVTEGEEYIAEGDVTFKSLNSGSASIHYIGTYVIEDGEAVNIDWDMEY